MGKPKDSLDDMAKELPPEFEAEVRRFLSFLVNRMGKRRRRKPSLRWAGALSDLREEYTSVELQHKISEWRIGSE